ncbi:MAG: murein biosynthesis integral membrane protein MurJ [Candidatus Omnitrophota bacterium]
MRKTIVRNTTIISAGTNVSRVLGLVRDIIIARLFGTGYGAGAFVVAFTLPNMLRDFIGEGAANAAFVPVLTEYKVKSTKDGFWKAANSILVMLVFVLLIVAITGVTAAPILVRIMAPGFIKVSGAIPMTVELTRMIFPYILFMGLLAYSMGVLNTLGHFAVPAFSHSLLNISVILSALFLCPFMGVYGLGIGVIIGGMLQVGAQIPVLLKNGFRFKWRAELFHPAVKKVGFLLAPRIMGTVVYQVNVLVDRMLASLFWIVGAGAVPALYYSYRLIQYPLGIFSAALATAALPVMANHAVEDKTGKLRNTVVFALKSVFFVMIPASVGLIVLGKPIIRILFQRGMFTEYSTSITYYALFFYSLGLAAFGGIKILAMCFYSMNDTVTPVKVAACSLVVNIIFNLALMWPLKVGGLALATSIAAFFNFLVLFKLLGRKLGGLKEKEILISLMKVILSAILMGIVCYLMTCSLLKGAVPGHTMSGCVRLLVTVIAGIVVYVTAAAILGMEEARRPLSWLARRRF